MLEGRGADLTRQRKIKPKNRKQKHEGAVEPGLMEGSLFPLPHSSREGNGAATEVRRFQGPPWAHLWPGVGSWRWACVRRWARTCAEAACARVLRACVCAVRARVPRVCTGVAAAGARPGRSSACSSLCAPARRSAASPPAKSVHAWGE